MRGELQTARELAEQLLRLAQSVQDQYLLSLAHAALGCTLYCLGELTSARTHLEQAIALYDPQTAPSSPPSVRLTQGWIASPIQPGPCGILAIQTRP